MATARKTARWREGTKGTMVSRFAAARVRPAHRDGLRSEPRPIDWILIEWPTGTPVPTQYWLSTVPEDVDLMELVSLAKFRWRIERDFEELKDELGLDHYEGRGWRGFHHHGVLCMAAYCFLAAERGRLSPSDCCLPQARSATPAFRPAGLPSQGRNGITRRPLPRSGFCTRAFSWRGSPTARSVERTAPGMKIYDTVVLAGAPWGKARGDDLAG